MSPPSRCLLYFSPVSFSVSVFTRTQRKYKRSTSHNNQTSHSQLQCKHITLNIIFNIISQHNEAFVPHVHKFKFPMWQKCGSCIRHHSRTANFTSSLTCYLSGNCTSSVLRVLHLCYVQSRTWCAGRPLRSSTWMPVHSCKCCMLSTLSPHIHGLSGKNPSILNISRTGCVAFMWLGSQSEEALLYIREQSLSRRASQSALRRQRLCLWIKWGKVHP